MNSITIKAALNKAALSLQSSSDSAALDAQLLLLHVIKQPKSYLYTWPERELTDSQLSQFLQLIDKRKEGLPVAHLIGERDFWTLNLEVNASTLIPRPDTETLVEVVLVRANDFPTAIKGLDLGTGTGAIALSLASELPNSKWLGLDYSDEAVTLAERNAVRNNVKNVSFQQSDWFSSVYDEKFHIIVSNPPYIDPTDKHLFEGDVRFEPRSALTAEDNGKADLIHIISHAPNYLVEGGLIALEHGYDQAEFVRKYLKENNFSKVETIQDLSGNDRITIGYFCI